MRLIIIAAALLLAFPAWAQTNNSAPNSRSWVQQGGASSGQAQSAASATTGGSSASTGSSTSYAAPGMAGAPAYTCAMSYSVSVFVAGFTWSSPREFCEVVMLVDAMARHAGNPEAQAMLRATDVFRTAAGRANVALNPQHNAGN
jgi:hypothetical protein